MQRQEDYPPKSLEPKVPQSEEDQPEQPPASTTDSAEVPVPVVEVPVPVVEVPVPVEAK
jgi:hypothetical protein